MTGQRSGLSSKVATVPNTVTGQSEALLRSHTRTRRDPRRARKRILNSCRAARMQYRPGVQHARVIYKCMDLPDGPQYPQDLWAFSHLRIPRGGKITADVTSDPRSTIGTVTLSAGTSGAIANKRVMANSLFLLTPQTGNTNIGTLYVDSIIAGTSFTIKSTNGSHAGKILWVMIN